MGRSGLWDRLSALGGSPTPEGLEALTADLSRADEAEIIAFDDEVVEAVAARMGVPVEQVRALLAE